MVAFINHTSGRAGKMKVIVKQTKQTKKHRTLFVLCNINSPHFDNFTRTFFHFLREIKMFIVPHKSQAKIMDSLHVEKCIHCIYKPSPLT